MEKQACGEAGQEEAYCRVCGQSHHRDSFKQEHREILEFKALALVREVPLTPEQWGEMVRDVITDDYAADFMVDAIHGWDAETLEAFVEDWRKRLGLGEIVTGGKPIR